MATQAPPPPTAQDIDAAAEACGPIVLDDNHPVRLTDGTLVFGTLS